MPPVMADYRKQARRRMKRALHPDAARAREEMLRARGDHIAHVDRAAPNTRITLNNATPTKLDDIGTRRVGTGVNQQEGNARKGQRYEEFIRARQRYRRYTDPETGKQSVIGLPGLQAPASGQRGPQRGPQDQTQQRSVPRQASPEQIAARRREIEERRARGDVDPSMPRIRPDRGGRGIDQERLEALIGRMMAGRRRAGVRRRRVQ